MHRARATIDLAAVRRNVAAVRGRLAPGTGCIAVVKADGYGHGAVPVARAALEAGAAGLAVTTCEEAGALRDAGLGVGALIMGPVLDDQVEEAVEAGGAFAVWSPQFVRSVSRAAARMRRRVRLHVKVDTGMHRAGVAPERAGDLIAAVTADPWLELAAVMTHFATADDDPDFMAVQLERFRRVVESVRRRHPRVRFHAANSAAALREPGAHFDLVRCGIALYGMSPFQHDPAQDGLTPALTLSSFVAALRDLEPGEGVSYGLTWKATRPTRVALIPIGYGDGFFRSLSNKGDVLIGGRRYPRVGTVCMDQFLVEVGRDAPVRFGDPVVLIGAQDGERITAEELAAHLGTINYEITCSLTARVKRDYVGARPQPDEWEDHG
ncbi:MAG: alanine racemase [Thermoleophilia bacterium]